MEDKKLVLVVDDEIELTKMIAKEVENTGRYKTVVASNGKEAFSQLKRHRKLMGLMENEIKCIVLDIKMPEMNGIQFLQKLRRSWIMMRHIPVIMLSAYEDQEKWRSVVNPREGNVVKYIIKPENPSQFYELIDSLDRVILWEDEKMIDEVREKSYRRITELDSQ